MIRWNEVHGFVVTSLPGLWTFIYEILFNKTKKGNLFSWAKESASRHFCSPPWFLLNHKQLVNSCNTTHNCAASGLDFIMVNNLCIWWSWSTFITSGSDKISRILASSSWEDGTAVCCLVLDLSVRPISLPCVLEALADVFGKKF